jgi:predicted nucleotidyltransferase component of viral defense system
VRDAVLALVRELEDPTQRLNLLREYLQACVLRSLHESEAFQSLSFVGGTALRFLFDLPRFSEDLDFSLEDPTGYEPEKWIEKVKRDLSLASFNVTVTWNDRKTVNKAWIRVGEILKDAGISDMGEQKLSIKLELDTRPPAGAVLETRLVNRHMIFALRHHELQSLMAGKIHALLTRSYPKGRDWYDLAWYRAKRPPISPNLTLLQNSLDQTQGAGEIDAGIWKEQVRARLETLGEFDLSQDAAAFLERREDAALLTLQNLRSIL